MGRQAAIFAAYAAAWGTLTNGRDLMKIDGRIFYLPHHAVKSPNKDKIRIVFNASATYEGSSLNDHVLQGPDLTNKLTSVLIRFREHEIAVCGDIQAMYYQIKVPTQDRDALRFLWFADGDVNGENNDTRRDVRDIRRENGDTRREDGITIEKQKLIHCRNIFVNLHYRSLFRRIFRVLSLCF